MFATSLRLDRITRDPLICSGKPCIRGMRIPVYVVVDLVAAGKTREEILADFPYLEPDDVAEALRFAALLAREELHAGI